MKRDPSDPGPSLNEEKDPSMQWPQRTSREAIFDAPFPVVAMTQGFCVGDVLVLATAAPFSLKGHKGIVNTLIRRRIEGSALGPADIEEVRQARRQARQSEDANEGRVAFRERHRPVFKGR